MLKQTLQQKLLQKLSPQQIQFIKLLQVPTASLDTRIKEELEENPALEDGSLTNMSDPVEEYPDKDPDDYDKNEESFDDEFSVEDYIQEDDYKDYGSNYSADDEDEQREINRVLSSSHVRSNSPKDKDSPIANIQLHARFSLRIVLSEDSDDELCPLNKISPIVSNISNSMVCS